MIWAKHTNENDEIPTVNILKAQWVEKKLKSYIMRQHFLVIMRQQYKLFPKTLQGKQTKNVYKNRIMKGLFGFVRT